MSNLKAIRDRMGLTQEELAEGIGCSQGLVWQMEHGSTVTTTTAKALIAFALTKGHRLTYDDILGPVEMPQRRAKVA